MTEGEWDQVRLDRTRWGSFSPGEEFGFKCNGTDVHWELSAFDNIYVTLPEKAMATHSTCSSSMWLCGGFPDGTSGKEPACQCRRSRRWRFDPWVIKILWRRAWRSTPVFLPGEFPWTEEPWGCKESDRIEQLGTHREKRMKKISVNCFLESQEINSCTLCSSNLWQRRQEYTMEKRQSLQ